MTQEAADMTAIVLPDIDRSTIDELKKRFPDLSEIELRLPSRKEVGKTAREVSRTADEAIDRLLGRKRTPVWAWIAAGLGLVAMIGAVAAWFAWFRRPTWESQPEPRAAGASMAEQETMSSPSEPASEVLGETTPSSASRAAEPRSSSGQSTADFVGSASYPIEEA